jgi:O-antigen/teichoic acid export membrane protein
MSYINRESNEAIVGLYRAGYTITGTYAALLFNAVSADFFPRLSGVVNNVNQRTTTVCQQIEVLQMLVGPMSVALLVAMPVLVPLLYDYTFVDMIPMTRIAVFGVLFSAAYIPAAYLPLAAGDSKMFLFVEIISTITMFLIIVGFSMDGLVGAGVGKVVSTIIDTITIFAIAIWYYKVQLQYSYILLFGCHVILLVASFAATSIFTGIWYWISGAGILLLSILTSWEFYKRKTVYQ